MQISTWKWWDKSCSGPHDQWALEGQPDPEPEPLPRYCRYCGHFELLEGCDEVGICSEDLDGWARTWRAKHPDGSWRQAVDATAHWLLTGWVNEGEDACNEFREEE